MTIKILITKQQKFWHKFLANLLCWRVSKIRKLIKVFKALWFLAFWPIEIINDLVALFKKNKAYNLPPNPKILIVKIDQLGDLLFSTWLLPAIKKQWPEAEIDYLINSRNEAILKNNPHIRNIYYWQSGLLGSIPGRQKMNLNKIFASLFSSNQETKKILKDKQYDLVINGRAFWPSTNRQLKKFGKNLAAFDISQLSALANIVVPYNLKAWEEDNYKELLKKIGVSQDIVDKIEARGECYNFQNIENLPPAKYYVLAPVSFDPEKTWETNKWIEFVKIFLINNPEYNLIASGTKEQREWLEKIKNGLQGQDEISQRFIIRTDLNLGQLAELIKTSQGFIGLESFPAHLAIALNKPVSCLVNTQLFYVPRLSKSKLVDGRSMLPNLNDVKISMVNA